MKKTILLLVILSLFSCKEKEQEVNIYDNEGKIIATKYLNSNHRLDSIICLKNGKIVSKMLYFDKMNNNHYYVNSFNEQGKLYSEGLKIKLGKNSIIKTGKWKFYDSKIKIKRIIEYINLCNKAHPNQIWGYDEKGKLDINESSYFTYKIGKSIIVNGVKCNELKIFYIPTIKKGSICTINLSQEINKNFCNVDSVEKFSLKSDDKFIFTIPIKSHDLNGKHNLKGFIEEHHFNEDPNNKSLNHRSRRVYIDVPIKI